MKNSIIPTALLLVFLTSCGGGDKNDSAKNDSTANAEALPLVSVVELKTGDFQNYIEVQGVIEADKNVLVNAETGGLIRSVLVDEGQRVSAGQTLAILDADMIAKSIEEVKKSLELATFVFEKQEALHKQNIGSELQFQQAKNNKERLEQSLETLKAQKSMSVISAPFSGYVEQVFAKEGEMANPMMPIVRLLDIRKLNVVAEVMENYLRSVSKGKTADINIRAMDTTLLDVLITRVGKYVNPANRSFKIELAIDNKNETLLPNMVTIIKIKNEILHNVMTVPTEVIQQSNSGVNYVYILDANNIVDKVDIITVASNDLYTVIENNPNSQKNVHLGDRVINDGARGLKMGMKVKVK